MQRPRIAFGGDGEAEREHVAGLAGVDDAVVPQARGGVERRRLPVKLPLDRLRHLLQDRLVDLPQFPELRPRDDLHHLRGLLRPP